MAGKPPKAVVDYESNWLTYDRWKQEDEQWYEAQKQRYDKENKSNINARADAEKRLVDSGIEEGSALWDSKLNSFQIEEKDYEAEYKEKQSTLRESELHKSLFGREPVNTHTFSKTENEDGGFDYKLTPIDEPYGGNAFKESQYENLYGRADVDNIYGSADDKAANDSIDKAKQAASGSVGQWM